MRKRYIQHPITHKLIPAEEYHRPSLGQVVQDDIEPFQSHVDGSWITSRSQLREHNLKHGVVSAVEYGDEMARNQKRREDFYAGRPYDVERRRAALKFALEVNQEGRSKAEIRQMAENYRKLER